MLALDQLPSCPPSGVGLPDATVKGTAADGVDPTHCLLLHQGRQPCDHVFGETVWVCPHGSSLLIYGKRVPSSSTVTGNVRQKGRDLGVD